MHNLNADSDSDFGWQPEKDHDCPGVLCCPRCSSARIHKPRWGRKVAGLIGLMAGAVSGLVSALGGLPGQVALAVSMRWHWLGLAAAVALAMLAAAGVGCGIGAALGDSVDSYLLNPHECLSCGFSFGPIAS